MTTWTRFETYLLPPPETVRWDNGHLTLEQCTTMGKVIHCAKNAFACLGLLLVSPITLTYDWLTYRERATIHKKVDIAPPLTTWPPEQRGFASSLFQTSGLGTKWSATPLQGKCDWNKWMDNPGHVKHPEGFDYNNFFVDILSDPTAYIEMLKSHHVTAHRFSLEWSVIEPKPGEIDEHAVALYQNFIQKLLEADITPSVTLSHFVVPEWFYESGNFQKIENVEHYVRFALKAMDIFPEVKDWWSFNELGVKTYQQAREVYPTDIPKGSSLGNRVHAAGIATRNMLIAHCKLHQEVARLHPDKKLGVTHQWLKFDTATGNWLESLIAYFLTKFGFTPVYEFFKDGRFAFTFPFMANIRFEIPKEQFEAQGHFLMRLGVQAYPQAMLKMGLNHGYVYPGLPEATKNLPFFTFGATCEPGGTVMRFGPRWNAKKMDEILDEAFALTDQVFITEYGSDRNVWEGGASGFAMNDDAQKNYLEQLTERTRKYCERTLREIKGIYCWSDLRNQMEWDNGQECQLAIVNPIVNEQRQLTGFEPTPSSQYLANVYAQPNAKLGHRVA